MKISTVSKVDEDGARAGGGGSHVGVAKSVGEAGPGDDNSSAVLTTPIRPNNNFSNEFFKRNLILGNLIFDSALKFRRPWIAHSAAAAEEEAAARGGRSRTSACRSSRSRRRG